MLRMYVLWGLSAFSKLKNFKILGYILYIYIYIHIYVYLRLPLTFIQWESTKLELCGTANHILMIWEMFLILWKHNGVKNVQFKIMYLMQIFLMWRRNSTIFTVATFCEIRGNITSVLLSFMNFLPVSRYYICEYEKQSSVITTETKLNVQQELISSACVCV